MANPKIEVEVGAKTSEFQRKFRQVDNTLQKSGKEFNTFANFAKGALAGIAAGFSVQAIIGIGRAVLDTTATFQKFNAVLTNTLGSSEAASTAFNQIKDFASSTPFQVDELTSSFVKLTNQGFKPTVNELRSLGDLAASTGKSFDQLAEAIIDAQVGEFERLKEFGIRAKKEGENVTFTFKGVETQVKLTDEAIRGYILSLGDAEGVSGAMAAISETLGGKLSNLGDNITNLQAAIGDQTSGVYATTIDWLNDFIKKAELVVLGVDKIKAAVQDTTIANVIQANREEVEKLAEAYQNIDSNLTSQQALAKAIADVSRGFRKAAEGGEAFRNQSYTISELNQIIEGFNQYAVEVFNVSTNTDDATLSLKEFSKAQDEVNRKFFLEGKEAFEAYNEQLSETVRLQQQIEDISNQIASPSNINPVSGIVEFGNLAGDEPPIKELADTLKDEKGNIISATNEISNVFINLGTTIADSLTGGVQSFANFGSALLKTVGAIAVQLGEAAIGIGVSMLAIKFAFKNPFTAIAAGVALVALGSALGSIANNATSGIGGGGGGGVGSSVSGTSVTGTGATAGAFDISGEFLVRGSDLVYVLDRQTSKNAKG